MEPGSKIRIGNDIKMLVKLIPGKSNPTIDTTSAKPFDGFIENIEVEEYTPTLDLNYDKIVYDKTSKRFVASAITGMEIRLYYAKFIPRTNDDYNYIAPREGDMFSYKEKYYKWENAELVEIQTDNNTNNSNYPININSIKAYLINTTLQKETLAELKKKTKFIDRFPLEPAVDSYIASKYNINTAGYPHYRVFPHKHIIGAHVGFGYNPDWNVIYKPFFKKNLTEYLAPVKATLYNDLIEIIFPANALLFTGEYKLVIVAKLYEPGYCSNNLRTVTTDFENVFSLVKSSTEATDEPAVIYITPQNSTWTPGDIYATSGQFDQSTGRVTVSLTDNSHFNIDMSDEVLWYEG